MLSISILLLFAITGSQACIGPPAPAATTTTTSTEPPVFPDNSSKVFDGYPEQCQVRHNNPNKNILFLGNSYTYFNDLPAMVRDLASAAGVSATTSSNMPGGQTFQGHTRSSMGTINSGNWDVVVLQEQSQKPAFPASYVYQTSLLDSMMLVNAIRARDPCTIPVFYQTWGRLNGDSQFCGQLPELCTFAGMQDRLTDSYSTFASTNQPASVAPVGEAFRGYSDNRVTLYNGDGSHPSREGTYIAASTLLETIWGVSPLGNSYQPVGGAAELQAVAHEAVGGNKWDWPQA